MELKINNEFDKLLDSLTIEEFKQLEENCINEGIKEPIQVWNETVIDGHNRYRIAKKNGLIFDIKQLSFENNFAAKEWIIKNQFGRRNLNESQKSYLRGIRYENEKLKRGGDTTKLQNLQNATETKLAKEYNVSERTINNDSNFSKGIDLISKISPEIKNEILHEKNEITKHQVQSFAPIQKQAEKEVKSIEIMQTDAEIEIKIEARAKELTKQKLEQIEAENKEKKEKRIAQREAIKIQEPTIINGLYDIVLMDPPWRYDFAETDNRAIENHYPTMSYEELKQLQIPCKENSILYMWATAPKLDIAMKLISDWGYSYKSCAIWDKQKIGMGYWFRNQHELLLVSTIGNVNTPMPSDRVSSVFSEKRMEHSKKPNYFYDLIEKMFPNLSYIEMFCRVKYNEKWHVWGNQV